MGKQARANAKKRQLLGDDQPTIELNNPNKKLFGSFIFGNSTMCDEVVQENAGQGKELVICGAGPSLRKYAAEYCTPDRDVWGCNSALTYLIDNGRRVTAGFTVDQTLELITEWVTTPDVEYLIASSVHPHLTELLIERGRKFKFFHNYVGLPGNPVSYDGQTMNYEDWVYCALYPSTVRVGSGLNTANRAIDLAIYMGYEKIYVLGMDCAMEMKSPPPDAPAGSPPYLEWLDKETVMHANGDSSVHNGASPLTLIGEIDGTTFLSKPDMLISAVWAVKVEQAQRGRVEIIGSDLIDILRTKPDDFLKRLPTLTAGGKPLFPNLEAA